MPQVQQISWKVASVTSFLNLPLWDSRNTSTIQLKLFLSSLVLPTFDFLGQFSNPINVISSFICQLWTSGNNSIQYTTKTSGFQLCFSTFDFSEQFSIPTKSGFWLWTASSSSSCLFFYFELLPSAQVVVVAVWFKSVSDSLFYSKSTIGCHCQHVCTLSQWFLNLLSYKALAVRFEGLL